MKSRVGFVSNSSTSSFIIKIDPYVADCLKAVGRVNCPTAWDAAMSIASVPYSDEYGFNIAQNVLSMFENKKYEIKYIYLDLLCGCEFLEMPSGNVYVEVDNCINADWKFLQDKSYNEIKYCYHFVEEMENTFHDDYELYTKIKKSYTNPNELFERDCRLIDTTKMVEYGKSLIILNNGKSIFIEKGIEPIWKSLLDMTEEK